jgi:hypothetical protein
MRSTTSAELRRSRARRTAKSKASKSAPAPRARGSSPRIPISPMLTQHSAANPAWGTPDLVKMLASLVLAPASCVDVPIELDYASSAYWSAWWPSQAPHRYLDGSPGRDVLNSLARMPNGVDISTGFFNAPGLDGGRMIQRCWDVFADDYVRSMLDSGVWVGFSIEQFASLQNTDLAATHRMHPLSAGDDDAITTLVPSRRFRYLVHPLEMIAIIKRKLKRARAAVDAAKVRHLRGELEALVERKDDRPIVGEAPPHASYVTILWSHDDTIAFKQHEALARFLREQAAIDGSVFQRCAVLGVQV